CRKNILPNPGAFRVRVFSLEREGQINFAAAAPEVLSMQFLHVIQMGAQRSPYTLRQERDPLVQSFAVTDGDPVIAEIDVFYAKPETFHQSQSAAVKQLSH